jgi:hypothetical protein
MHLQQNAAKLRPVVSNSSLEQSNAVILGAAHQENKNLELDSP